MRRSPGLGWCLGRGRLGGMVFGGVFFSLLGGGGFWFWFFGELGFFGGYDADEV